MNALDTTARRAWRKTLDRFDQVSAALEERTRHAEALTRAASSHQARLQRHQEG